MSLKKTVAILAAAGALAAISVPAMALENEFHGYYTLRGYVSNYNDAAAADVNPSALRHHERANQYAEQRARIFYTGKASDDLKLVTAFEMDTRFGGVTNGKYTNTSDAGVLDGDGINFETKWVYLDFNALPQINIKTGLMPYKDSIKGLFIDADVPAVMTTTKLGAFTLGLGYARFNEANQTNSGFSAGHLGDKATDLLIADSSIAITKDAKVGLSYYLLANYQTQTAATASGVNAAGTAFVTPVAAVDNRNPVTLHTIALNADAKVGPLALSGFAAAQLGQQRNIVPANETHYNGYALNAAARLAAGPGTAKIAGLWVSGDEGTDTHNNGWVGSGVQSYNESGLMLLVRNNATSGTTTTNEFLRRTITNVILATAGYDAKIGAKGYLNANLGMAWAAKNMGFGRANISTAGVTNASNYLGTELALETGYKVYDNLTASVQGAYLLLGGYYKKTAADNLVVSDLKNPDNPYTARLVLTYAF
jgi:hypothetical protein